MSASNAARDKKAEQVTLALVPLSPEEILKRRSEQQIDLAKKAGPLAVALALIGFATFIEPGLILGAVLIVFEVLLGGISIYHLWPKA